MAVVTRALRSGWVILRENGVTRALRGGWIQSEAAAAGGSFLSAWAINCNTLIGAKPMKKNVASQKIGAQLVSATDGSAFTGSVTVEVTGDAGTQATGSVGSGACTHEGNGYHTYAPAQAETNYDLIAFTFHGTGAVPVTIQVFTTFPQTGDNFARIGAPAGASVSADVAAIKSDTAAILVDTGTTLDGNITSILADTNELQTDWANGGRLDNILDARASQASVDVVDGIVDDILVDTGTTLQAEVDGIQADTEDIQARLPAALTADGNIKADALRISGSAESADRIERSTHGIVLGTCTTGGTTTAVVVSALSPASAVNDQFNGRIITFAHDTTTAALRGQSTDITDFVHATQTFTVTALTTAPASGDQFVIT